MSGLEGRRSGAGRIVGAGRRLSGVLHEKADRLLTEWAYLRNDAGPALRYLEEFRRSATQLPIAAPVGALRGYSSLTVVADLIPDGVASEMTVAPSVLKFDTRPGKISWQRLSAEQRHDKLARQYLKEFTLPTLRVWGHGMDNKPSALVVQTCVLGTRLRDMPWRALAWQPHLAENLASLCRAVHQMWKHTGQLPDLAGTLPRVDYLTNLFWRSRHIILDESTGRVWLVDPTWKPGEETLRSGSPYQRTRTLLRLISMNWFGRRLERHLALTFAQTPLLPPGAAEREIDLSVIIVNWNTRSLLAQCLESLFAAPPKATVEVFVVDNGSTDDSAAMVRERFPQVRLIANATNRGFASANNQALRLCLGRSILLLNSDTIVPENALDEIVGFMAQHPDAGFAGLQLLNPDGSPQTSYAHRPTLHSAIAALFWVGRDPDLSAAGAERHVPEIEAAKGAAIILRREALEQVGLLDERFFMYSEEIDLCMRLTNCGWRGLAARGITITHLGGQSSRLASEAMFQELYRSKTALIIKHFGWMAGQIYRMALVFACMIRVAGGFYVGLAPDEARLAKARLYRRLFSRVLSPAWAV